MPPKKLAPKVRTTRHSPMEHPRHQYPAETEALQAIAKSCGLTEEIKWGKPCFTRHGKNVVLIQRFNEYIALMFFQGALLKDPDHILSRIGEHMQVPRQIRFKDVSDVLRLAPTIKAYLEEAIALEESGVRAKPKRTEPTKPAELVAKLESDPAFAAAFAGLTPGRQKAYIYEIGAAKQSATRTARLEKYVPQILAGKGLRE